VSKLTAITSALYLSMMGAALADYTLSCKSDLPGGPARTDVTIKGVNTLPEACRVMRSDPKYSEYQVPTCVDVTNKGRAGTCAEPADPRR
jgi:hypothetical protein